MKVTLGELVNSVEGINIILKTPVNSLTAFRIGLVASKVDKYITEYRKTERKKIIEYGELIGDKYNLKKENNERFYEEINALLEEEIELDVKQISITELKTSDGKEVDVEPKAFASLMWLIKE